MVNGQNRISVRRTHRQGATDVALPRVVGEIPLRLEASEWDPEFGVPDRAKSTIRFLGAIEGVGLFSQCCCSLRVPRSNNRRLQNGHEVCLKGRRTKRIEERHIDFEKGVILKR